MDKLTPERRSENMRRIRSEGMKPELLVRRLLSEMGYRYRLNRKDLPGKPDLVFPGLRKVIFVHGCFWHSHATKTCVDAHLPKSNRRYWLPKLLANKARDARNRRVLRSSGWGVLVLWECGLADFPPLKRKLRAFLGRIRRSKVKGR